MNRYIYAATIVLLAGCSQKSGTVDQSTPQSTAEMIFSAARSGDFSQLKDLCDPSLQPDHDSRNVCAIATGDDEMKADFKEYFSTGKVVGDPIIQGDKAMVAILFGPDGKKQDSFNMTKKDGKWYLISF